MSRMITGASSSAGTGMGDMLKADYDPDEDGVIAIPEGGTGAQSAAAARANLSAAQSGANSDITSLTGLTTPLGVVYGGTGADNAGDARDNLGIPAAITAAIGVHEAAANPHPTYLTEAEADLLYADISHTHASYQQTANTGYRTRTVAFVVDGGGSALTTGYKANVSVPFAGTITKVRVLGRNGQSGSIVVDLWKDTYANFPPTVADTITAAAKPTITTSTKTEDSTLTGWTTAVTAGDIISLNIDSVTTFTWIMVELTILVTA